MQSRYKQISLNVPEALLTDLTDIAKALSRPRTEVILRSLSRDLPKLRLEASKATQQRQIREKEYGTWEI